MASSKKNARIYLRVSTDKQDLERQRRLVKEAEEAGYYIAGTYEDKASGISIDRPGLNRLLDDLRPGDVIIAEDIDRISRLPIQDARKLVKTIQDKKATLAVNGLASVDFRRTIADYDQLPEVSKIVLDAIQTMLLEMALEMAHSDYQQRRKRITEGIERAKKAGRYKGRPPNARQQNQIVELVKTGLYTNSKIAALLGVVSENGSQSTLRPFIRLRWHF